MTDHPPKRRARNASPECERATRLEKYYTLPAIAQECTTVMRPFLSPETLLIEPSAGAGSFVNAVDRPIIAFDIDPDDDETIISRDFMTLPPVRRTNIAFIGNPPFGKSGKIAAQFINHALAVGGLVGFILPITFRRWSCQRLIRPDARLVLDHDLPERAFDFVGKPFDVRCSFQVWTLDQSGIDLRLREKPPNTHPDFDMYQQHASMRETKFIEEPWDFGVVNQRSYDYGQKIWSADELNPRARYTFMKASSPTVLRRLLRINFGALAKRRPVMLGYSKADVVEAYNQIKENENG